MSLNTKTVIVKVTNDCNFDCKYCFLEKNIPKNKIVSKQIIRRLFEELQNELDSKEISILWHGGEPLLAGIDFFKEMVEIEKDYKIKFRNEIQTNGSLITDEFANFFIANEVHVGLSLDGPQKINDLTRRDRGNNGTFVNVMNKIKILKEHNLQSGVIATISKCNVNYPEQIYSFFKENNLPFQFNPLFYSGNAKENFNSLTIRPEEYTEFLIRLGKIWLDDPEPVNISVFDKMFGSIFTNGNYGSFCSSCLDCHKLFLAVGPTGELYPCCLFQGYDEFSYGNILDIKLRDILNSPAWKKMSQRKMHIQKTCSNCSIYDYCYGGCPFIAYSTFKNINTKDYYCSSYKQFVLSMMKCFERKMESLKEK